MQLADELEATQEMVKADWKCWKKFKEPFSDSDEDDQDKACQDKRMRQRRNVDLLQHAQEMDMSPYSLSLPPTAWVSGTKSSAERKRRKTRSKRAGTFISCAAGSGEKIIKEEAKNKCARPHSGIRLSVINQVDNNSMGGEYDKERNKTNNETANSNTEMSIGGTVMLQFVGPTLSGTSQFVGPGFGSTLVLAGISILRKIVKYVVHTY